jgi:hypothetical protein
MLSRLPAAKQTASGYFMIDNLVLNARKLLSYFWVTKLWPSDTLQAGVAV